MAVSLKFLKLTLCTLEMPLQTFHKNLGLELHRQQLFVLKVVTNLLVASRLDKYTFTTQNFIS